MRTIALAGLFLALTGCGGEGGGNPKVFRTGTHTIDATCGHEESRWLKIEAQPGTFTMTVTWDESGGADVDLWVEDEGDFDGVWDIDAETPPGDSPAMVTVALSEVTRLEAEVTCYEEDHLDYEGTMSVP